MANSKLHILWRLAHSVDLFNPKRLTVLNAQLEAQLFT